MSDEVIKTVDALADKFGIAIDWTSANVIPYLQQLCERYVKYEVVTNIVWILIGIVLLVAGKYGTKKINFCQEKFDEMGYMSGWDDRRWEWIVFTVITITVGLFMVVSQGLDIVTCLTFPEKVIIRELQSIYSSMH